MAMAERWMVSNPSAEVDTEERADESERTWAFPVSMSTDVIATLVREHLAKTRLQFGTSQRLTNVVSLSEGPLYTGTSTHHSMPELFSPLTGYVVAFAGETATTTGMLEESISTSLASDQPLLQAVARATDEQKESIWRILGAADVQVVKATIEPIPQLISPDWLEDALSVHARPTPVSLEEWYEEDSD